MRIRLYAYGPGLGMPSFEEGVARVVRAEADGFATAWVASPYNREGLTLACIAGRLTKRIEVATAVVPIYFYHPFVLAQHASAAQAATGNRFTLGIGAGHPPEVENTLGLSYGSPIRHMRECLAILNGLFSGERLEFHGQEYHVASQLRGVPPKRPGLIVSALGPKMLQLAGSLADGTVTWMGGPKYLEKTAIPLISRAAHEAGRPTPRIIAGVPVAVTDKAEQGRDSANANFAYHGRQPEYRAILDIDGSPDPAGACIIGNEAQVGRKLRHLASIGVTDIMAAPFTVKDDPEAQERTYGFMAGLAKAGGM